MKQSGKINPVHQVGLVLEGGGMRSVYTAGVLDYFMDRQLFFPYVVGVSAGASTGLSYVSRQRGRALKTQVDYIRDPRYLSLRNFLKDRSLFNMEFLFDTLPNELIPFDYDTFFHSPETMLIGTLDCHTGETKFFSRADYSKMELMEIIKASCSMPLLSPMIKLPDGSEHLDGGTSQPIPIDRALQDGYDRNVVVLTRNMDYRKSPPKYMRLVRRIYKDYPNLINIFETRHTLYNETLENLEQWEQQGKVFIIRPNQPLNVSRLEKNPTKLRALYKEGLEETQAIFPKLLAWINEGT